MILKEIDKKKLEKQLNKKIQEALIETAEDIKKEIIEEEVIPKDTGATEKSLAVSDSIINKNTVFIITGSSSVINPLTKEATSEYVRKIYYDPDFYFHRTKNKNAKERWYDDWITGKYKDHIKNSFFKNLNKK